MTQPPTPGTPNQIVKLGGAKVDAYGDAVRASIPEVGDFSVVNTFRGEGIPVGIQKGRPLAFTVNGGDTLDLNGDVTARKLLTCQAVRVNKISTGQLNIALPSLDKFLKAGFKIGMSGSISIGITDTANVGSESFQIVFDPQANYYGATGHLTRPVPVTHRLCCQADFWIDMNATFGLEDQLAVLWMPKWTALVDV